MVFHCAQEKNYALDNKQQHIIICEVVTAKRIFLSHFFFSFAWLLFCFGRFSNIQAELEIIWKIKTIKMNMWR